ncbi:tripartite tricarboxylate transporter substrate binding protein [Pigmentiphaga sp. H8]|uniref:Bug family tripartite tricarboxylate transporter substrate binding protein n=1 Tax=unclassified Pigmentiphaga TaxID=2626614 RepID=UPI000F59A3C7|nr:tripartite tricarboxylate transporter substrate binding protein [Pigmentiphaga sp. H8]AZG07441.1 tripartite tricarboxylate transporter substrate binding protein [Pigmentiphaga sp. H8]
MRKSLCLALGGSMFACTAMLSPFAWAQAPSTPPASFPTRAITMIVPYTPGSGADILARAIGPIMSRELGQPVVVENRAGASGTIGTTAVVRAAPDGHTLLMSADTITITPSLYRKLPFSPQKDLAPVGRAAQGTLVLVANPEVPAQSVAELVALAKQRPGQVSYASPGSGTPQHVLMELFKQSTGTDMQHVPYKGMAGALTDLIGGQVQVGVMSVQVAMNQVTTGRLRLLGVGDYQRLAAAPDVPTFQEMGYPEMSHPNWFGLFAPAHTPPAVVDKLNAAMLDALKRKEVQETLNKQGMRVASGTPAELARQVEQDMSRWSTVISKAGITAD